MPDRLDGLCHRCNSDPDFTIPKTLGAFIRISSLLALRPQAERLQGGFGEARPKQKSRKCRLCAAGALYRSRKAAAEMPSPFPGMDPFIEPQKWSDFHVRFISDIADGLMPLLREEHVPWAAALLASATAPQA